MGLGHEMTTLLSSIKWITKTHKGSTLKAKAARLAFCASVYYIWHTRNENLFDDGTKTEDNVIAKVKHMLIGVFGALVSFMDRDGSFQDAFNDSWKQMISRHPVCFYYSTGTIVVFLLAGIIGFAYYLWAIDTEKREEFRIACLGWIILECVLTSSKTFIPLALALISAFTIFGVAYGFFLGTLAFHKSWQKHRDVLSKRCLTEEYVVEDLHGYYFAPPKLDPEHEERLRALKLM
ncbi:unnamed protein product [Cuscuta epithymum]|nr:unnamed protein product [Cuscuta epithymum]